MSTLEFQESYKAIATENIETMDSRCIQRSVSSVSVRPEFTREDYEKYRPSETIPKGDSQADLRKIMKLCISSYERVGVIRSVIDMMSEFAAEGVEIVHPDDGPNEFYKAWQKRVHLENRVERALNWAFKSGQFVVRRQFGQIDVSSVTKYKPIEVTDEKTTDRPGYIPLRYVFYNPSELEVIGGRASSYSTNQRYALRLPTQYLTDSVKFGNMDKDVIAGLPIEIRSIFTNEKKPEFNTWLVPLDPTRIFVGFYKKDDDQIWAKSFIYALLNDIFYNDKVKQAKISTMDNMISIVRLWKLGDHTHGLLPPPALGAKLASILGNHTGGGPMDIVWDSAIDLQEFYPPIDKLAAFEENYHAILLGLGVPESLVGGSTEKSNMTSNSLGFKNLIKRLEAGRRVIVEWLESEIDIVQKNMGFRKRPYIKFANEDLYDERTYYTLLLDLMDRNVLSDERILEVIDEIPEIEQMRVKRETEKRNSGDKPEKTSPYHNPQLKEQQKFEVKKLDKQLENSNNLSKQKSKEATKKNGRPGGSPDKVRRKRGPNRSRNASTEMILEANRIYAYIENFATEVTLSNFDVKDVRTLTSEQKEFLDKLKSELFATTPPHTNLSSTTIQENYTNNIGKVDEFNENYYEGLNNLDGNVSKITNDDKKLLRIFAYIGVYSNDENL